MPRAKLHGSIFPFRASCVIVCPGPTLCPEHMSLPGSPIFWNFGKASRAGFPGIERQARPISCVRPSLLRAQHATVFCGENFCKSFPHTPFKNLKQGVRQRPETGGQCAEMRRAGEICAARRISVPEKTKMCRARNKKTACLVFYPYRTPNTKPYFCLGLSIFQNFSKASRAGLPASNAKHAQTRTPAPVFASMLFTEHEIACRLPVFPTFRTSARHPAPVYRHRTPSTPKPERLPRFFASMLCTEHEIACPVPVLPSFGTSARRPAPGSPASNEL